MIIYTNAHTRAHYNVCAAWNWVPMVPVPVAAPAFQRCGCVPLDENCGDVIAVVTTNMGPALPAGTRDEFHLGNGPPGQKLLDTAGYP